MKKMRKIAMMMLLFALLAGAVNMNASRAEAKASKKAMKFLKGTWCTVGNSNSIKVVFTRNTMNFYDCWKSDTEVYGGKKKGKLIGKNKILWTKKKGKKWIIKTRGHGIVYYKGSGDGLINCWKKNGKWMESVSDSLFRL